MSTDVFLIIWLAILFLAVLVRVFLGKSEPLWKIDSGIDQETRKQIRRKILTEPKQYSKIYIILGFIGGLAILFMGILLIVVAWNVIKLRIFTAFLIASISTFLPLFIEIGIHGYQYYYWIHHPIPHVKMVKQRAANKTLVMRFLKTLIDATFLIFPVVFQKEFFDVIVAISTFNF